jgi:hypothetical protein
MLKKQNSEFWKKKMGLYTDYKHPFLIPNFLIKKLLISWYYILGNYTLIV